MIRDKNSKRYSYVNHDSRQSKFIHKDFNKTESYHSNFSGVVFQTTSFIATKLKFCSLYEATFDSCCLRGTLFRGCNLQNATFKNSIISATIFEKCKLKGCRFENCKIISSTKIKRLLHEDCFVDTEFFDTYPDEAVFNLALISTTEGLRANDFIRRSSVLHRKKGKIDTVSLKVLIEIFGEEFLISHLEELPKMISNEFHTLSYIIKILLKIQECSINRPPVLLPLVFQN